MYFYARQICANLLYWLHFITQCMKQHWHNNYGNSNQNGLYQQLYIPRITPTAHGLTPTSSWIRFFVATRTIIYLSSWFQSMLIDQQKARVISWSWCIRRTIICKWTACGSRWQVWQQLLSLWESWWSHCRPPVTVQAREGEVVQQICPYTFELTVVCTICLVFFFLLLV